MPKMTKLTTKMFITLRPRCLTHCGKFQDTTDLCAAHSICVADSLSMLRRTCTLAKHQSWTKCSSYLRNSSLTSVSNPENDAHLAVCLLCLHAVSPFAGVYLSDQGSRLTLSQQILSHGPSCLRAVMSLRRLHSTLHLACRQIVHRPRRPSRGTFMVPSLWKNDGTAPRHSVILPNSIFA